MRRIAAIALIGAAATLAALAVVIDPEAFEEQTKRRRRSIAVPVDVLSRWTKGGDA